MSNCIEAIVIKAYNSFYYVKAQDMEELLTCKLRGKFKQQRFSLLVGDKVLVSPKGQGEATIEQILPRSNALTRPAVANVEQIILVLAIKTPDYSYMLIDRLLALYERVKVGITICFNKCELASEGELEQLRKLYKPIGYEVIFTSTKQQLGIESLKRRLQNKVSVFAGPSGVGKSSLLNELQPGLALNIGAVSDKIGRGKHTTRYSQLMPLDIGGYIADTPGFSSVEAEFLKEDNLNELFKDIQKYSRECRFSSCKHDKEPQCAVKQAVEVGELSLSRYDNYLSLIHEIAAMRK